MKKLKIYLNKNKIYSSLIKVYRNKLTMFKIIINNQKTNGKVNKNKLTYCNKNYSI